VTFTTETATWPTNIPPGDDGAQASGDHAAMLVDGAGAKGYITSTGQIDSNTSPAVLVRNGGYFEVEEGGRLSSFSRSFRQVGLIIQSGGSAVNNGVIASGYLIGNNLDTAAASAVNNNQFGYSSAVSVTGPASTFTNNGILNVAGQISNGLVYGVLLNGGSGTNSGIINVSVNNNSDVISSGMNGVIAQADTSNFINEAGALIYVGRAAQYNVAAPEAVPDTANAIVQRGVFIIAGTAINDGDITIGTLTQNATAMSLSAGASAASSITNTDTGVITVNGAVAGGLQNIGMSTTNTAGQTTNAGAIELTGVNAVALKVLGDAGTATSATHSGTITVAGGIDADGLRNYAIWAEGANATASLATGGDGDGIVNLDGDGAIGVHARNGAKINLDAGSGGVNFVSGVNQLGFFTYGAGSSITNNSGVPLLVNTNDSTLFRVEDGAIYTGVDEVLTASGVRSTLITGSGAGTTVTTNALTFSLTGNGTTGIKIDGGATGTVSNDTIIELEGNGAIAGLVDGRKINLAGTPGSSFDSVLTNNAAIASNATDGVGFITQFGGTLNNNGVIDLGGTQNFGIIARSGGILNNTADVTVANGVGLLVEGEGSASQLSNAATITANDGIAAIEVIDGATLNGDASTGEIVADGSAHGVLIAAAGPDPQDPSNDLAAGAGASLGANTISVKGTGNGVENAAEVAAISFTGTTISATDGAAVRTATLFAQPPVSTATLNVSGSGTGFLFEQANGDAATGPFDLGSGYTINVTGEDGRGIFANTAGAVTTAATVNVTNVNGGAALEFSAEAASGKNTGTLSSNSTRAATVDASAATGPVTFTNTGTITNTSAAPVAIAMAANATANIGDPTTVTDAGSVTGAIQLASGTNSVLITDGSSVTEVVSNGGTDTVTIRGAGNSFTALSGTPVGTQTA
ncbi:MAG: hypothetical protein LBE59_12335, partial [Nevskiaceae bacterium]|nr:hypothetical protein [Nevskiaceae bacterium]